VKLLWSPLALERVNDIASYIALDKPTAAENWVLELFERVERLPKHPRSGRKVPEIGIDRIREIMHGSYRVIYAIDDKAKLIEILTVRRGSEMLRKDEIDPENT